MILKMMIGFISFFMMKASNNNLFYFWQETSGHQIDDSLSIKDLSSDRHITVATVRDVYLFMGRELELMDSVPAGNVLGIVQMFICIS